MSSSSQQVLRCDLAVVGGGAGGLSVARAATQRGAKAVIVQDGPIGGDCTFTGCVPSKALLERAARGASFAEAMTHMHEVVARIAATEDAAALAREGITVVEGRGRLVGPGRIAVGGTELRASKIVLATGARAAVPPIPGLSDVPYLTNETVFDLADQPASLLIIGGGAIGCELATAFAKFGTAVTLIEGAERLLPLEEPQASEVIRSTLEALGVAVRVAIGVVAVGSRADGVTVTLADGSHCSAAKMLIATGRAAVHDDLGLESVGVRLTSRGWIETNDSLATTAPDVWAIGDVTGKLPFTHAADEMGRIAAANALSRLSRRRWKSDAVPWVTFTDPEVARVGLAEAQAPRTARVAELPMTEVDRAITTGRTEGFVKLIVGPRAGTRNIAGGRVLGATIVAPRAGEMIHEIVVVMRSNAFPARLAQTVHAYPTWSIAIRQAAAQLFIETGGRVARPVRSTR